MNIIRAIETAYKDQVRKGWDKTYWFFDLHGTILRPNYTYGNVPKTLYDYALETLQLISQQKDICMIMYTCSHPNEVDEYLRLFESYGIHFQYVNENPEVKTQTEGYGCYDTKPYMNVLFEDKAGFSGEEDWPEVYEYLKNRYGQATK